MAHQKLRSENRRFSDFRGFTIVTDKASQAMLQSIQTHLNGIGSIREGTKNELVFTVLGINQIVDVLVPFIDANPILSEVFQGIGILRFYLPLRGR